MSIKLICKDNRVSYLLLSSYKIHRLIYAETKNTLSILLLYNALFIMTCY